MGRPTLPIELWEIIFELTTACSGEWEFGNWEHSMTISGGRSGSNTVKRWVNMLKTRRSLVAVSQNFNQLATPLLYQSFFAIRSSQISRFALALQARPSLGGYVKRLSLHVQPPTHESAYYPLILRFCPNIVFYDAELRLSTLRPVPALHSLELVFTPGQKEPWFPHLLAGFLRATPQLEYLGLYRFPYRIRKPDSQPFASIILASLRSLHVRMGSPNVLYPTGVILTASLFLSLALPRLEDLLLVGSDQRGAVLDRIPAPWLQHIRQFNVTHRSIARCRPKSNQFPLLQKFTLDFSLLSGYPRGELHHTLPFIQLEEINLIHCTAPLSHQQCGGFEALSLVFRLCADDTATPKLRLLSTDITADSEEGNALSPTQTVKERLNELQSVVELTLVRRIDPKGLNSCSLHLILQILIKRVESWVTEVTYQTPPDDSDEDEVWVRMTEGGLE